VPPPAMHVRFWPAITRRAAASSVAQIVLTIGAPCVLQRLVLATQNLNGITGGGTNGP
jgi:hypothetical protein